MINDWHRPGKTPDLVGDSQRRNSHERAQKYTKSYLDVASLFGGNAHSSPPPRPFQLLGVLGELGVGRFHAKGAKPAKGSLGRSPFCGFSQVIFLQKGIDSGGAKEHNPDLL